MNQPIEIFQTEDAHVQLEISLKDQTVWLTQSQICELFCRERSVITKHIGNVFKEGELDRDSVCANFARTAEDGKTYQVEHYNLDVIISVGYRVKSKQGVQFRKWATRVLNQYLVQGYALNEKRLKERGIEFEQAIALLSSTLTNQALVNDDGQAVLQVVSDYARSWSLLQSYDEQSLADNPAKQAAMVSIELDDALRAIEALKQTLIAKGEATALFGQLRGDGLASALATIEQGFGDEPAVFS